MIDKGKLSQWSVGTIVSVVAVTVIGIVDLQMPFVGDQAFFTLGARAIADGRHLYSDFWDIKQPGIFWFFFLGGRLFGFTEVGVHLFELTYWVLFMWFLTSTVHEELKDPLVTAMAPLLTVGMYYASSGSSQLTQLEMLVAFPLLGCVWAIHRSIHGNRIDLCLVAVSGLCGGIVLLFKLVIAPLLLVIWLFMLIGFIRSRVKRLRIAAAALLITVTSLLPLWVVFLAGAFNGNLEQMIVTFFKYPIGVVSSQTDLPLMRLLRSAKWFLTHFGPMSLLAVYGLVSRLRSPSRRYVLLHLCWVFGAGAVVLIQFASWWPYHFLLFVAPVGVLAAIGVRDVNVWVSKRFGGFRRLGMLTLMICCLCVPNATTLGRRVVAAVQSALSRSDSPTPIQDAENPLYGEIMNELRGMPGIWTDEDDLVVLGHPLYLYLAGKKQIIATNGWILRILQPGQWINLEHELRERAPRFLYVEEGNRRLLTERSSGILQLLSDSYTEVQVSPRGTMYQLAADSDALD